MDPAAMQQAMQMMQGMDPQQLQQMMGNINPAMMQQAQAMAKDMGPQDWERARAHMQGLTPQQLQQQAATAQQHLSAQEKYMLSAAQRLKADGNQLHSAGSYQAALEKYERAKTNIQSFMHNQEAQALFKACALNLSSCYLNLKQYSSCVVQCDEVIAGEPRNLKALYRRGQARMGLSQWREAAQDLEQAAQLSAADPEQLCLINERLKEAREKAGSAGDDGGAGTEPSTTRVDAPPAEAPPSQAGPVSAPSQQQDVAAAAVASALHDAGSSSSSARTANPMMSPEMMKSAADMMRNNPQWAQQVQSMMSTMSDEELQRLSRSMGQPISREMLERGQQQISKLRPEDMERMAQLQHAIPASLRERLRANPNDTAAMAEAARHMQANPVMMTEAASMMARMDPDQLAQMAKDSGAPFSPEMARMAAESLRSMPPEQVQAMAAQAAAGRGAPPPPPGPTRTPTQQTQQQAPSTASASSPAAAGQAVQAAPSSGPAFPGVGPDGAPPQITPEMAKMAGEMMSSMPPEQLQSMLSSMGGGAPGMPQMTPEMIKMASEMMKGMSPEELARMSSMMGQGPPAPPGASAPSSSASGAAGPSGAPPAGGMPKFGAGGGGAAEQMMNMSPAMMEQALNMMRTMDEGSLISMLQSTGMVKSQDQAEAMAKQMRGMSDTQVNMLLKFGGVAQKGVRAYSKARAFVASRVMLIVAVLVLLVAFYLRWMGYM